jgi:hypothetical protein
VSKVVLRVAQVVGVLVLAGIAISVVAGLLQWIVGLAILVAIPVGGYWIYKRVSGPTKPPAPVVPAPKAKPALTGGPMDRKAQLESRAVIDASGRCGWCGATELHKDQYGFPTTPLQYHRAEIDAML